jgi:hypothetical protein
MKKAEMFVKIKQIFIETKLEKNEEKKREKFQGLYLQLADKTAYGQAQNASFDYLISQCVVYNDSGKQYFSSYDDYVARKGDDDANECAQKFYELLYNRISDDAIQSLPENQFLKEFGFVDDKMRLINDKGQLVDDNGRLVDEDGNWINDEGKKIDFYGNLLDEKGKPILNRKPFTKAGQPIVKE